MVHCYKHVMESMECVQRLVGGSSDTSFLLNERQCEILAKELVEISAFLEKKKNVCSKFHKGVEYISLQHLCSAVKRAEVLVRKCCCKDLESWLVSAMTLVEIQEEFMAIILDIQLWRMLLDFAITCGRGLSQEKKAEEMKIIDEEYHQLFKDLRRENHALRQAAVEDKATIILRSSKIADLHGSTSGLDYLRAVYLQSWLTNSATCRDLDLKNFDLVNVLGRGGCGIVLKVKWLGVECALKVLGGQDEEEATALKGLFHPNIIRLFHYWEDPPENPQSRLLMELMPQDLGAYMRGLLKRTSSSKMQVGKVSVPFSLPVAIDIMYQIAEAMRYMHGKRLIHRDLKPANILVKERFQRDLTCIDDVGYLDIKLADFGLVKSYTNTSTFQAHSKNKGTGMYRAPEILGNDMPQKRHLLTPADVWSFGITCVEILSGKQAYAEYVDKSPLDIQTMICKDGLRPTLPEHCPQYLAFCIKSCLELSPLRRPEFAIICKLLRHAKLLSLGVTNLDDSKFFFAYSTRSYQVQSLSLSPSSSKARISTLLQSSLKFMGIGPRRVPSVATVLPAAAIMHEEPVVSSPVVPEDSAELNEDIGGREVTPEHYSAAVAVSDTLHEEQVVSTAMVTEENSLANENVAGSIATLADPTHLVKSLPDLQESTQLAQAKLDSEIPSIYASDPTIPRAGRIPMSKMKFGSWDNHVPNVDYKIKKPGPFFPEIELPPRRTRAGDDGSNGLGVWESSMFRDAQQEGLIPGNQGGDSGSGHKSKYEQENFSEPFSGNQGPVPSLYKIPAPTRRVMIGPHYVSQDTKAFERRRSRTLNRPIEPYVAPTSSMGPRPRGRHAAVTLLWRDRNTETGTDARRDTKVSERRRLPNTSDNHVQNPERRRLPNTSDNHVRNPERRRLPNTSDNHVRNPERRRLPNTSDNHVRNPERKNKKQFRLFSQLQDWFEGKSAEQELPKFPKATNASNSPAAVSWNQSIMLPKPSPPADLDVNRRYTASSSSSRGDRNNGSREAVGYQFRVPPPGSYQDDDTGPSPKNLLMAVMGVKSAVNHFAKVLITNMNKHTVELEYLRETILREVRADMDRANHWKFLVQAFICKRLFDGFDAPSGYFGVEYFENDVLTKLISFADFSKFKDKASTISMLLDSGSPDESFLGKFCFKKFKSIFGQLPNNQPLPIYREEWDAIDRERHPRTVFYQSFLKVAVSVWLVHRLVQSFEEKVEMLIYEKGAKFQRQSMESVVPGSYKEEDEEADVNTEVGFSVIPGFQVAGTVVKCEVYLRSRHTDVEISGRTSSDKTPVKTPGNKLPGKTLSATTSVKPHTVKLPDNGPRSLRPFEGLSSSSHYVDHDWLEGKSAEQELPRPRKATRASNSPAAVSWNQGIVLPKPSFPADLDVDNRRYATSSSSSHGDRES